jgi:hypothetical protein
MQQSATRSQPSCHNAATIRSATEVRRSSLRSSGKFMTMVGMYDAYKLAIMLEEQSSFNKQA